MTQCKIHKGSKSDFFSQHLSPVMVMVNPSYSFPGSFKLGTLELTVKPSLVLLLNCFRKYRHTRRDNTMQGGTQLFYSNTVASNSKSINAASRKNPCQA